MPAKVRATKTAASPARRTRVPNAERSAATREKLIEATIRCLREVGYHQTSTVLVTETAGSSRGAMLHHFPSKADLMMATMQQIRAQSTAAHKKKREQLSTDRERFLALVDILWAEYQTPTGIARVELLLGARNDPELGPQFAELTDALDKRHKEAVWNRVQSLGVRNRKKVDAFVQLYTATLRGLAIASLYPHPQVDIKGALALLKEAQLNLLNSLTD